MTDHQLFEKVLGFLQQTIAYSNEEMSRLDELKRLVRERLAQSVHASDISQEPVDETEKDRHEWVDLTQQEVEQIYSETQDEFQFSQLLAYKLREKNSGWNGKGWA